MFDLWIIVAIGLVLAIPGGWTLRALWRWFFTDDEGPIDPDELIAVSTGLTDGEAEILRGKLEAFGIRSVVSGGRPLPGVAMIWDHAALLVRVADHDRARAVLGDEEVRG